MKQPKLKNLTKASFIAYYGFHDFGGFFQYMRDAEKRWHKVKTKIMNKELTIPSLADEYRFICMKLLVYLEPTKGIVELDMDDIDDLNVEIQHLNIIMPTVDQKFYKEHKKEIDEYIATLPKPNEERWKEPWETGKRIESKFPESYL